MPSRLLLAAEILRDVARTINAADRPLLEAAADELAGRAAEILADEGTNLASMPRPVMVGLPANNDDPRLYRPAVHMVN